jgi:carbohydrate kinase (thermoresistant glucokinase family)
MPADPPATSEASPIVVVAGVSGVGKTTVGRLVAERLGLPFADADAYHDDAARGKMAAGSALTDHDRAPWLARLARVLEGWRSRGTGGVLACSALAPAHRDALAQSVPGVQFVHLQAPASVVAERLADRAEHFFPPHLLPSQLATLDASGMTEVDAAIGSAEEVAQRVVERVVGRSPA